MVGSPACGPHLWEEEEEARIPVSLQGRGRWVDSESVFVSGVGGVRGLVARECGRSRGLRQNRRLGSLLRFNRVGPAPVATPLWASVSFLSC